MPGVTIRTATRSGPVNQPVPTSGRFLLPGVFSRGPIAATLVRSLAEVMQVYGDRPVTSHAWDALRTYFEEGGSEAVVTRVVGPAATTGTITLKDTADVSTVRVDAASPGAWSSTLVVNVTAGAAPGSVDVTVADVVDGATVTVEKRTALSTVAQLAAAFADSRHITVTDLGSTTAAPGNLPKPGAFTLTGGADDNAAITSALMTAALDRLGAEWGAGAVAIPGHPAAQVGAALLVHAQAHRRIALIATAKAATEADAVAAADALINAGNGEYGGLFYPWVEVPGAITGTTMLTPPEGYVAAMRARAHRDVGPWRAPGGDIAKARYVLDAERTITRAESDRLDEAQVSAIRVVDGSVRLYGWRSLSTDAANYALLVGRDVVNAVADVAERRLERYVFATIDAQGQLLASVAAELVGILDPIRSAGGLFPRIVDGEETDPGYSVTVDDTLNTPASLQSNTINAAVALRVSPVGALVNLTIVKAGLLANV